jgi:hypothetical protein
MDGEQLTVAERGLVTASDAEWGLAARRAEVIGALATPTAGESTCSRVRDDQTGASPLTALMIGVGVIRHSATHVRRTR